MSTSTLIPTISIDALLAARDAAQEAIRTSRRLLDEAAEQLARFGVEMIRVNVHFTQDDQSSIRDPSNADAIAEEIDRLVWTRLFILTNVATLMDHKTRGELFEKLGVTRSRRYGHSPEALPPLTRENIESTITATHDNQEEYFEKCIEAVYRGLSWEHKTNEPTRIGEKLIMKNAFYLHARRHQGDTVSLTRDEMLHDMERVLALLDGQAPPIHGIGLRGMGSIPYGEWTEVPSPSGPGGRVLMQVKPFRIGTTHVRILNQKHVDEMNLRMARRFPGAIPPPREAAAETERGKAQRPKAGCSLAKTDKQARQAFYTPADVSDQLVRAAAIALGRIRSYDDRVEFGQASALEPSAGEGAIVRALLRGGCEKVTAIENDPHGVEMLRHLAKRVNEKCEAEKPALRVIASNFFDHQMGAFDAVVMNPPFSSAQEVEHVLRAWEFVKPGGVLVSVMSASAQHRTSGRYSVLQKFFEKHGAEFTPLPSGSFQESGTNVSTVMVVIKKKASV
jgi:predicted RNA methylase